MPTYMYIKQQTPPPPSLSSKHQLQVIIPQKRKNGATIEQEIVLRHNHQGPLLLSMSLCYFAMIMQALFLGFLFSHVSQPG